MNRTIFKDTLYNHVIEYTWQKGTPPIIIKESGVGNVHIKAGSTFMDFSYKFQRGDIIDKCYLKQLFYDSESIDNLKIIFYGLEPEPKYVNTPLWKILNE